MSNELHALLAKTRKEGDKHRVLQLVEQVESLDK